MYEEAGNRTFLRTGVCPSFSGGPLCTQVTVQESLTLEGRSGILQSGQQCWPKQVSQGFIQNLQGWRVPLWAGCYNYYFPEGKAHLVSNTKTVLLMQAPFTMQQYEKLGFLPVGHGVAVACPQSHLQLCMKDICSTSLSAWSIHSRFKPA